MGEPIEQGPGNKDQGQRPAADEQPLKNSGSDASSTYSVRIERTADDSQRYGEQKVFLKWQLAVAIATTLVGFFGLIYLNGTLSATKKAANAAQKAADTSAKQLELSERPWMSADVSIAGPFVPDKN